MIRLDMSECQTPDSLGRILGEKDKEFEGMSLIDQVRNQPFSVVLLDDFEKAHPAVWDLSLQIYDDGRLTDKMGNTVDFRHAILIMTSNLGGDVSQADGIGFASGESTGIPKNVGKAITAVFRKEFINRIDRVVAFRPLSRSTMREILHKELDEVLKRRGLRNRSWAVEREESAIEFLLDKGFDFELGARPLKRAVERYLLSPLALTIVNHQFPEGDQFLFVRSDGERIVVEFIDPDLPDTEAKPHTGVATGLSESRSSGLHLGRIALDSRGTSDELEFLRQEYADLEKLIAAETWKATKSVSLEQMSNADFWQSPERFAVMGKVEYMDRIEAGLGTAGSLIERISGYRSRGRKGAPSDLVSRLAQQLYLLQAACAGFKENRPRDAFLSIQATRDSGADSGASNQFALRIANMYRRWAAKRRMQLEVVREESGDSRKSYSLLLAISGYAAFPILAPESGLHVLETVREGKQVLRSKVTVHVAAQPETPARRNRGELLRQALAALECEPVDPTNIRPALPGEANATRVRSCQTLENRKRRHGPRRGFRPDLAIMSHR